MAGVTALLAACDPVSLSETRNRTPDPFEAIRNTDLQPRYPQQMEGSRTARPTPKGESYFGSDSVAATNPPPPGAQQAPNGEGYELNFENAPVTTVAKVIIGDILGAGYTIDPRIQGTVTVSSGRPIPKNDLLFVLENALRTSNVVMVSDPVGYRLIPAGDAVGAGRATGDGEPGYGVTAVPIRYASAQAMMKLLDSFALKAGSARVEPTRNLILVQGSGAERRAAVDTILSFDVDWMRGQSVGIYPLEAAAPEAIIAELEKVMESGDGGLNHDMIKFQPIGRLNAVLVVTKKPHLLRTAATWVKRLDRATSAAAGVRVYRLRYGSARQIALILRDMFSDRQSGGLDTAANQIAPGAGAMTTSSGSPYGSGTGSPFGSNSGSGFGLGQTRSGTSGLGAATTGTGAQQGGFGQPSTLTSAGAVAGDRQQGGQGTQTASVSLPGIRITADVANNALLIFSNQENYRLIEETLRQLDRPQLQVAIHATIAEITLTNELRYGVQAYLNGKYGTISLGNDTMNAAISRVLPGFNLLVGPESNPKLILDALRSITDVKVLSTPSVVVLDNQVATLQVGDQVPIATQSATILTNPNTPLVNTIDYRNTGVILRVLPRVNVNGNVILDIEQEISNVSQNANANTLTPTVSQRKVKSSIAVASNQSVLLGGLISERQERGRFGIPILEELPGIGDAFARNTRNTTRTELIIFIRPQIIRDSVDSYRIAEELRAKLRGSAETAFPPGPSLRKDPLFVR